MKSAAIIVALLVALLLFAPATVSAAGLPGLERSRAQAALEQEDPGATPSPTVESTPESTPESTAESATATPTDADKATDEAADEEARDAGSGVADLHATAARLRGRVELGWRADDGAQEGSFVVERSTNGSSWRPVKACSMKFDPEQAGYGCTDTRLTSGTTYSYRVCLTDKGSTCANVTPSEPVTVKAP